MNKKELTWRIRVYGIVQGVGFRPTVSRHATSNGICGTVCNKGPYVEIYAQGQKKQMEGFLKALEVQPPKRAAILKINSIVIFFSFSFCVLTKSKEEMTPGVHRF